MRCYNGCPDSDLQKILDDATLAHKQLAARGVRATYFPAEAAWMVFKDYKPITGFYSSVRNAANAVIAKDRTCT